MNMDLLRTSMVVLAAGLTLYTIRLNDYAYAGDRIDMRYSRLSLVTMFTAAGLLFLAALLGFTSYTHACWTDTIYWVALFGYGSAIIYYWMRWRRASRDWNKRLEEKINRKLNSFTHRSEEWNR